MSLANVLFPVFFDPLMRYTILRTDNWFPSFVIG